ncbi:MAG: iron chelate uptake ABC transporter family permease subunit [Chloroflexi bacterium]|nr:iron chelate uptake ABC transporter family permease subunit [Chloroflexota bacterium]
MAMRSWARRNPGALWALLATFLAMGMLIGASLGAVPIAPERVLAVLLERLFGWTGSVSPLASPSEVAIVMDVRLPRLVTAALVGAALALAGVIFQGLLRNPLADPYVIGTAAGAALGASIALILSASFAFVLQGFTLVPLAAFWGAWGAVLIVYRVARVGPRVPIVTLLLAGFALSSILTATMAFLWLLNDVTLRRVIFWTMGGLSTAGWAQLALVAPLVVAGLLASRLFTADLNALLLGEEAAAHLGVEVERRKFLLLALGSLLTAAAVSISGLIGFVGLVIPHVARLLVGPDHRTLLPASALIGLIDSLSSRLAT